MIKQKLQELGFSEKEVNVYLALLELGSGVASDIAQKAKIKRSTTYVILDLLAGRGMTSVVERRGVQVYSPAPPEQLVEYLKGMSLRYTGLADTAKKLLPELKASRKTPIPSTPKVQMFQGLEGIKTAYKDTLATLEEIRIHAGFTNMVAQENTSGIERKHATSDIKIQTVILDTSGDHKQVAPDKEKLRKILLTSRSENGFSSEINIYDDRVVFISVTENFALIAESKEFAAMLRNMCDGSIQGTMEKLIPSKKFISNPRIDPNGLTPAFG